MTIALILGWIVLVAAGLGGLAVIAASLLVCKSCGKIHLTDIERNLCRYGDWKGRLPK